VVTVMETYWTIHKGEGHPVYCEDHLYEKNIDEKWYVAAVMDGCSSGKDSHFASALFTKIINRTCNNLHAIQLNDSVEIAPIDIGLLIAKNLFNDLSKISKYLELDYREILSTIILLIYNKKEKISWILVSGDGYIAINGEITVIDQHNQPDYLGFHLDIGFDTWFTQNVKIFNQQNVNEIAISTDGVGSFYSAHRHSLVQTDVVRQLLLEPVVSREAFQKIVPQLKYKQGLQAYDDIAIVRVSNSKRFS